MYSSSKDNAQKAVVASYEYKTSMQAKGKRDYVALQPMNEKPSNSKIRNAIRIRDDAKSSSRLDVSPVDHENENQTKKTQNRKILSSLKQTTVMS